jgi:hypothetical protein
MQLKVREQWINYNVEKEMIGRDPSLEKAVRLKVSLETVVAHVDCNDRIEEGYSEM